MTNPISHYANLLAEHYSWMFGTTFEAKVVEQQALLDHLLTGQTARGLAIDLGCGPGYQSAALVDLGFDRVIAIDTSNRLLTELGQHCGARPIEPVLADMRDLGRLVPPATADVIVCMGDTLTHLSDLDAVRQLFTDAAMALTFGGMIALTFRDLSVPMAGLDRIIPIRADDQRIMTCILDYEPERVVVTDIIHVRQGNGWDTRKSNYCKLRLSPVMVADMLNAAGLEVRLNEPAGRLWAMTAIKQPV